MLTDAKIAHQLWVGTPNTPDGNPWEMAKDPHGLTAFTSPNSGAQYAILDDDYALNGTRTFAAVVDLQALLALPRSTAHQVTDPLPTCEPSLPVQPAGCVVRFIPAR